MARRRPAALALAALALALGGCQAAHASTASAWHPPAARTSSGSSQPDPAPSPANPPSTTPTKPATTNPSASTPSDAPDGPPVPAPASSSRGHGPAGAWTTTGTAGVALTFDDGPDGYSMAVLDLLAKYHIKATFCVIGRQVAAGAAVIRRIVADGHTLCNHTWSHDIRLKTRTAAQIESEMQRTNDAIHAIVPDAPIKYFRNPGGEFSDQTVSIAASLGMKPIYWQVDPQDWRKPSPQAIINNVIGHTRPGSIVLMHDGGGDRSATVTALRTILPNFAGRFTLIPLPT
jgi:peptidoglycan/xylan/chitin deacetylase (PgdA/CDA1 family)